MKASGTLKAASGTRIVHRGKVANIHVAAHDDYDHDPQQSTNSSSQMSNTSTSSFHGIQSTHVTPMTTKHQRTATVNSCYATKSAMTAAGSMILDDSIVVIDSSPDEKNCQRIIHETIDYDDDNDKSGIIGTEVSLSSVALTQNAMDGDDVSVIYDSTAGNDFNIVSSDLLGSEDISEEYQLQFPVFTDYVDDGEREHTIDSPTEDDAKSLTVEDTDNDGEDDNDDVDDDGDNEDNDENDFVNLGKLVQVIYFALFSLNLMKNKSCNLKEKNSTKIRKG